MPKQDTVVQYPDLKGSELHFDLKNKPGEDADETHAQTGEAARGKTREAITSSDDETQIADALRKTVKKDANSD
jgi:hypothetical protein